MFNSTGLTVRPGTSALKNLIVTGNHFTDAWTIVLQIVGNAGSTSCSGITISNNIISLKNYLSLFESGPMGAGSFVEGIMVTCAQNVNISGNTISHYEGGIGVYACANTTISQNSLSALSGGAINTGSVTGIGPNAKFDCTGTLAISNNATANCCFFSAGPIISVQAPLNNPPKPLAISIVNNKDNGPANNASYYINCLCHGAKVTGNTTTTLLPNNIVP